MKLHVNSAILEIISKYICMDAKCFYLNNQMDRSEYIMIQIYMIPQTFVEIYNLKEKSHDGYIFSRLTKGVYELPQSGQIAHDALVKHLEPYGYRSSSKTPFIWTHDSTPTNFTLVVNDFRVKYLGK